MIETTLKCSREVCWNVRESGLIALSYVFNNIKEFLLKNNEENNFINDICSTIKMHCFDNVIEVRDAAAFAMKIFLEFNKNMFDEEVKTFFVKCVTNLNNSTIDNEIYPELKQEIFSYITDKQDFGFIKEVELNEVRDGIVQVIKEICDNQECFLYVECGLKKEEVLMLVIDYLCKNYKAGGLTNLNKKTIWEALTVLFLKINKFDVEFYIDYIVDILLTELDQFYHSLCGYQAERFVIELIKGGVSKSTIKGKVRSKIKGKTNLEVIFSKIFKS